MMWNASSSLTTLFDSIYYNNGLASDAFAFIDRAKLRQNLPQQYSLIRQIFMKHNPIQDEEIARLQVLAYNQRENSDYRFNLRLSLALAYYTQGRRCEARQELLNLLLVVPDAPPEQKIQVALVLAAAGDCNTALKVVAAFRQFEMYSELLPFFQQLQIKQYYHYCVDLSQKEL